MSGRGLIDHAFLSVLALFVLLPTPEAWAERYKLFARDRGSYEQSRDYDRIVARLAPGDELSFSNGEVVRIGRYVDSGNTTLLYEVANEPTRLIRIPKGRGVVPYTETYYTDFMSSFQVGKDLLARESIPMVNVHHSVPGEFAIVDRVPAPVVSLGQFLREGGGLDPALRSEMENGLVEFAKKTAGFEKIGDFHAGQLVYHPVRQQWILIDWTAGHRPTFFASEESIKVAGSLFIGTRGRRADFFSSYLRASEGAEGAVRFEARLPQYEWIAKVANRIHETVKGERFARFRKATAGSTNSRGPAAGLLERQNCLARFFSHY